MEILLSYEDDSSYKNEEFEKIINKVLAKVSELYGLEENSEVSVVLVSDAYIHTLNKK